MSLALDRYAHLDSPLHRWEPRCKLIGLLALIFAFAFVESWFLIPVILGISAGLMSLSRLPLRFFLRRLRYPGLFLLVVVMALPWLSGTTVLWQWGTLTLRQEGLVATGLIASRFVSILCLGLVLFGTTPFLTLIRTLRSLRLSPVLTDIALLTYRYLFDVSTMLAQMQQAMRLRGFQLRCPKGGLRPSRRFPSRQDCQQLAALMGTLLIRSYEQSERTYQAMRLRGHGQLQPALIGITLTPSTQPQQRWSILGGVIAVLIAVSILVIEGLT
ncbi:cobalt ECF transporter T component CbiQ [Synechococcales cyanobacterium C]|uniref:Cobalt ECF transporter T component CbiQ n=2 Tax=Petrachloros TaxID=2918834 RepID=A0A8K2A6L3_9CYAN|nr:cobalt ECF transporter T component CbiQ [Petrachloros mirabilis]NCJ05255.1 cobalt ECF transporter T component CbiQ [Petrachloros mirabilis ULC683]